MAEKIVDLLVDKFKAEEQKLFSTCETKHLKISGGDVGGSGQFKQFMKEQIQKGVRSGLTESEAEHLAARYGSNVTILFNIIKEGSAVAEKYNLPLTLYAKLQYALEHELAATPIDFFNRRISAILFDIGTVKTYKDNVVSYMRDYFEWDESTSELYKKELAEALDEVGFLNATFSKV
jgi:glycerol-3-phosphate dehydrogenase